MQQVNFNLKRRLSELLSLVFGRKAPNVDESIDKLHDKLHLALQNVRKERNYGLLKIALGNMPHVVSVYFNTGYHGFGAKMDDGWEHYEPGWLEGDWIAADYLAIAIAERLAERFNLGECEVCKSRTWNKDGSPVIQPPN